MSNKLPNNLINRLKLDPQFNSGTAPAVQDGENEAEALRFNPEKAVVHGDYAIKAVVPWCVEGYYLKEKVCCTRDPLFHAGCYYPQAAGEMFMDHAIRSLGLDARPLSALDLYASGGKSTLINAALHQNSLLVANEMDTSRRSILAKDLMKWGAPNVVTSSNDSSAFGRLPGYFDLLVMDAPCSRLPMLDKAQAPLDDWSVATIQLCQQRQQRILSGSLAALKKEGYLFYSTSSSTQEENEDIVDWIIAEFGFESVPLSIQADWEIKETTSQKKGAKGYRFYSQQEGEAAFYFAVLRKTSPQATFSMLDTVLEEQTSSPIQQIAADWLQPADWYTFEQGDSLSVIPKSLSQDLRILHNVLNIKNYGTQLGTLVGGRLIPSHDLALSIFIKKEIQAIDVNKDDALLFLEGKSIRPEINVSNLKGWILMRYNKVNLGWIEVSANEVVNGYPQALRLVEL